MLKLRIIAPDRMVFEGEVESVTLPGTVGSFTVLNNHAPIISSLDKGKIAYKDTNGTAEVAVESGFAEVRDNVLSICVEI
ncbi:MAG: ATP synthase F1 subunit epsilon [Bacteroidaceae bacterium]|nr:ATP synthase F1 subunit epsilon [Bacteroidaceae bacterium]